MQKVDYNIPKSIDELFKNKGASYSIEDYSIDGRSARQALSHFLTQISGYKPELLVSDSKASVILQNPAYDYQIEVKSFECGDCFSHAFDVGVVE